MAAYLARASVDLRQLERIVAERPVASVSPWAPTYWQPPAYMPAPQPPAPVPPTPKPPRSDGWIGKALAVAGVAVTLVGVALLLVLAAQAGILRPGFRGVRRRLGGRAGGSRVAAGRPTRRSDRRNCVGRHGCCGGVHRRHRGDDDLPLGVGSRRAHHCRGGRRRRAHAVAPMELRTFGLLVLVPLIGLGPVVADGITVVLVGFMLALGAVSVPVQLGKDWNGLHAARTAVTTLPLLLARY